MTAGPLFAGTVFSGVLNAMVNRNFFYDKEPDVYTTEPIPATMIRNDNGEEMRIERTAYHYEEDFFGDFVYASHYGTTECLTRKLRYKFCEVEDVVLSD